MFEIISEGKAERILDLLSDAAYLTCNSQLQLKVLKRYIRNNNFEI
jgi:hypothetical protein